MDILLNSEIKIQTGACMFLKIKYFLFFSLFIVLPFAANATPISFGLEDYIELGQVKDRVKPIAQKLSLSAESVSKTGIFLQAAKSVNNALPSSATLDQIVSVYDFYNNVNSLVSAAHEAAAEGRLEEIIRPFTNLNTHPALQALRDYNQQIGNLESQLSEILPSSIIKDLPYAVAASSRAMSEAIELQHNTQLALNNMTSVYQDVYNARFELQNHSEKIDQTLEVVHAIQAGFRDMPFIPYILAPIIEASLSVEADLISATALQADILKKIDNLNDLMDTRTVQLTDLDLNISSVLENNKPLPSEWKASVFGLTTDFKDPYNPYSEPYSLKFVGNEWTYQYTEIEGEFFLGTLGIRNNIAYGAGSNVSATLDFELLRSVDDMIYENPILTWASVPLTMNYFSTPNLGKDSRQDADYFRVPYLGINLHFNESDTAYFNVYGQYDSPLRIVRLELLQGSTGGFITEIPTEEVPEPTTLIFLVSGLAGLTISNRRRQLRDI